MSSSKCARSISESSAFFEMASAISVRGPPSSMQLSPNSSAGPQIVSVSDLPSRVTLLTLIRPPWTKNSDFPVARQQG